MTVWNLRSKRKKTSGKYHRYRKKKRFQRGSDPTETEIGKERTIKERTFGGNVKVKLKRSKYVNLTDSKTGKTEKVEIKDVLENRANIDYVRRDIITKGSIILTDRGKAKVTSRPGQHGVVNAILLD